MALSDSAIFGAWLEDGQALQAAGRWRFAGDGTFTFTRQQSGSMQHRRGTFRMQDRGEQTVLRLEHDGKSSLVPVRLSGGSLQMLVRADGAQVVRAYRRANTQSPAVQEVAGRLCGRWERADTRHDEMIGEFYEFAPDASFVRVEGCHRNLQGDQTSTFDTLSVRAGIYLLEQVGGGIALSFEIDGQLRLAGKVRLSEQELTLDGPRPMRLLRRVVGPAFRRQQEAG
ncbi:MAG: hypothetical protein KGM44_06915 [bacterium]|nr:hypothetical protein [bacterium]